MKRIMITVVLMLAALPLFSKEPTGFGAYAVAGTNTGIGLSAGAGAGYLLPNDEEACIEIGLGVFYFGFSETRTEEALSYTYNYSAKNIVYAVMASLYFNYKPQAAGMFEFVGAGVGGVSLDWDKNSSDMPSYNDSDSETGGVAMIIPGVGGTFGNGFEIRAQLPVFITFTQVDGTQFTPSLLVGAGLRL